MLISREGISHETPHGLGSKKGTSEPRLTREEALKLGIATGMPCFSLAWGVGGARTCVGRSVKILLLGLFPF